ncbi:porphobilinogen synthase [Fundidesulfovibrio butyratiphilus]
MLPTVQGDFYRGRRLRASAALRDFVRETKVSPEHLVMPYFAVEAEDENLDKPITTMPGQSQLGLKALVARVGRAMDKGLRAVMLFGIPAKKDASGSQAYADEGIVQRAVAALKAAYPGLLVLTDVCLCEYTSHGHCGMVTPAGDVRNDVTLELLARTAVSHAKAGADIVAPSDMMDGRVLAIRQALDHTGFKNTPIMSYAVKYASAFYGPFREAAESAPQFGDRKTYQMDPGNWREALREAGADVAEGADFLMVKPAGPCLDIIRLVRESFELPLAAYQVSGEYAQIKAAAQLGWMDHDKVMLESVLAIKRAGADIIITYFAEELLGLL